MSSVHPLRALLIESVQGARGSLPRGVESATLNDVMTAALMHRVRPAVRRRLLDAPEVPEGWLAAFTATRTQQIYFHLRALADMKAASAAFADAGVRWVVAKGPVLSSLVWPSPDMREYSDLDLFVHPHDLSKALESLEACGFTLVDRNWPEMLRQARAEIALTGPSGTPIDLHWNIVVPARERRVFRLPMGTMIARGREADIGVIVPTFDPTDTLLHVAFHAAQNGASRLVWTADVRFASQAPGVDWDALASRCQAAGVMLPVALMVARVERVWDIELPLPAAVRRRAQKSLWGRRTARADARTPFPGLPGQPGIGGFHFSSARRSVIDSAAVAVQSSIEVRLIEARVKRRGPDLNLLDEDVPDRDSRARYLASATTSEGG